MVKNLSANAGDIKDMGSIPGSGRSLTGGHGNSLRYSCLEKSMDRRARGATVPGISELDTTGVTEHVVIGYKTDGSQKLHTTFKRPDSN